VDTAVRRLGSTHADAGGQHDGFYRPLIHSCMWSSAKRPVQLAPARSGCVHAVDSAPAMSRRREARTSLIDSSLARAHPSSCRRSGTSGPAARCGRRAERQGMEAGAWQSCMLTLLHGSTARAADAHGALATFRLWERLRLRRCCICTAELCCDWLRPPVGRSRGRSRLHAAPACLQPCLGAGLAAVRPGPRPCQAARVARRRESVMQERSLKVVPLQL
jgi:hypothetical protein